MNIQEALKKRIPRVRRPVWADPGAYLRLPLLSGGEHGPWAELYEPAGQMACELRIGSQRIGVWEEVWDDLEPFVGEPSLWESHPDNLSSAYLEE